MNGEEKEVGKETVVVDTPKTGRESITALYKTDNPDVTDELNDDSLLDFMHSKYSDLEGRHNKMTEGNSRLAEMIGKDPKLGATMNLMIGGGKSFPYSVGRVYGKTPFELEGEELEQFEEGYQEQLKQLAESDAALAQASKNIETYKENLSKYGQENGLGEEELGTLNDNIYDLAERILHGDIPVSLIEIIHKGMNYDKDLQEAADTGFVEGKNDKVDAKLRSMKEDVLVPDLGGGTGAGRNNPISSKNGDFFSNMKSLRNKK